MLEFRWLWVLAGIMLWAGILYRAVLWQRMTTTTQRILIILFGIAGCILALYLVTFRSAYVLIRWLVAFESLRNITTTFIGVLVLSLLVATLAALIKRVPLRDILLGFVPFTLFLFIQPIEYLLKDTPLPTPRYIPVYLLIFVLVGSIAYMLSLVEKYTENRRLHYNLAFLSAGSVCVMVLTFYPIPQLEYRLLATQVDVGYEPLTLVGVKVSDDQLTDEPITGTMYWRINSKLPVKNYITTLSLIAPNSDESAVRQDVSLQPLGLPQTRHWFRDVTFSVPFTLPPPEVTQPMTLHLALTLREDVKDADNLSIEKTSLEQITADSAILTSFAAVPEADTSPVDFRDGYVFANGIRLGIVSIEQNARTLDLVFQWGADQNIDTLLTQMLHFYHPKSDTLYTQDMPPFEGRFRTLEWFDGMFVEDTFTITLPDDLPNGRYIFYTGLYDSTTIERIGVINASGNPVVDSRIALQEITIP